MPDDTPAPVAHTPGPWESTHRLSSIGEPMRNGRFVILKLGSNKREDFFIAEMPFAAVRGGDRRECEGNARLIVASANSYMKHCADPIAAAERDLLGDCLEALEAAVETHGLDYSWGEKAANALHRAGRL